MTISQISEVIKNHAFDFNKFNTDIKSEVLVTMCAEQIYNQYIDLLGYFNNQNYTICEAVINTLKESGYYIDMLSLNRTKTIDSIIGENNETMDNNDIIDIIDINNYGVSSINAHLCTKITDNK